MAQTQKTIVVLGAGFGGVYTFRRLHKYFHKQDDVRLILVDRKNYFLFTPLLHEVATGNQSPINIVEPLRKVLKCCMTSFYMADATSVDIAKREVTTSIGTIQYDSLVFALGGDTAFFNTPGAAEHCFTLKSLEASIALKNHCIEQIERASKETNADLRKQMVRFVIVGGGPTGVELVAEIQELVCKTFSDYYHKQLIDEVEIILLQRGSTLLPQFHERFREISKRVLEKRGVDIRLNTGAQSVSATSVTLSSGEVLPTETVVWVGGIQANPIQTSVPLEKDAQGRFITNEFLQIKGYPELFAIGDMAHVTDQKTKQPLPATAQVAVKEGTALARILYSLHKGSTPKPFIYRHDGDLLSLGKWMAIAEIGKVPLVGHLAWWVWRTIYLSKLLSFQKKVRVAVDWTINIVAKRDISQL